VTFSPVIDSHRGACTAILFLTIPQNKKAPKNLSAFLSGEKPGAPPPGFSPDTPFDFYGAPFHFILIGTGITSGIRLFKVKNGQMVETNPG
jgi:hypothetical protein